MVTGSMVGGRTCGSVGGRTCGSVGGRTCDVKKASTVQVEYIYVAESREKL